MQIEYDCCMKWNDRLRAAFEAAAASRGISQKDLAKACSASSPSVSDWLSGETKNIEARYLIPACRFLKVSPFWIMLGDDAEYDFEPIAPNQDVGAVDIVRLISAYSQTADEGRSRLLEAAEETKKLFPRR
jgi:transcriptional regulator with XRE-family HTH domain